MTYNVTNVTDANNIFEIVKATDDLSGGLMMLVILGTLFLVLFIALKKYEEDTKKVLLVDSTIMVIISILFWGIELISWQILLYPIIIFFAALIMHQVAD